MNTDFVSASTAMFYGEILMGLLNILSIIEDKHKQMFQTPN
jgi:hypothetical protein